MTLHRMIHKLRLKPGDILVLRAGTAPYNLIDRIMQTVRNSNLKFEVPIIMVHNRQDLSKLPFERLEQAYLVAKEAHERRETKTQRTAKENQEGTRGETVGPIAGGGTPADPVSS